MSTPTAYAVSPDSGEHWSSPGAFEVAEGVHRIPLPLPMDGLKAVNVYVIETEQGLTLVDGGWAVTEGREALEKGLRQLGRSFTDIRRFLVTHVHRDHFSLAAALGTEVGADVALGLGEKATLDVMLGVMLGAASADELPMIGQLRASGAAELARVFGRSPSSDGRDESSLRYPDSWFDGDLEVTVGGRTLDAIHTPGHTQGHYVFAEQRAGLLFAGDHVLPTITPSIGFEPAAVDQPLRDFMASLAKVRALPDLTLLPAHGPVAPSVHARVDELLEHHEDRLARCLAALSGGPRTAYEVAGDLPWTRHEHRFETLDDFNAALAAMETKAHLELLVARGRASRSGRPDGVRFALPE